MSFNSSYMFRIIGSIFGDLLLFATSGNCRTWLYTSTHIANIYVDKPHPLPNSRLGTLYSLPHLLNMTKIFGIKERFGL